MSDALNYTRASKIRRFSPLASTSGNRNYNKDATSLEDLKRPTDGDRQSFLSNEIQRLLLHVGMRVRKSIPEGYKRGPEAFEQALNAHSSRLSGTSGATKSDAQGHKYAPFNKLLQRSNSASSTKKRSLNDDTEAQTASRPVRTTQTLLSLGPASADGSKVRRFAIPKGRIAKPSPDRMEIDGGMLVDEHGEFKDAEFLAF